MPSHASKLVFSLALVAVLASGCETADRPPEETTSDGLVRVPARSVGGVYRAPDATFTQYQRVILEPPSISFIKDWAEKHPKVGPKEMARIRAEVVELFRDEFAREFVSRRSPFKFAEEPAPDVLLVVPAIEDLDMIAPDTGSEAFTHSYTTGRPVTMKVTGDLRDAMTGKLIGRVIIYHPPELYANKELRAADRTANAHEQRIVYADWSRLVREALNVAKTERPRPTRRLNEITFGAQHLEVTAGARELYERRDGERRRVRCQALLRGLEPQRMHLFANIGRDDFTRRLGAQHGHRAR